MEEGRLLVCLAKSRIPPKAELGNWQVAPAAASPPPSEVQSSKELGFVMEPSYGLILPQTKGDAWRRLETSNMAEPAAHWDEVEEPDLSQVVTEDDEAVEDVFSERQQRLLVDSLYASG